MITREDRSYASQILPILITVATSMVTVQYLYTFTNQSLLLIIIFGLIYIVIEKIQVYIQLNLYPERHDGGVDIRRVYMVTICDLIKSFILGILTKLFYDIFNSVGIKLHIKWYQFMVAVPTLIVFSISLIKHAEV